MVFLHVKRDTEVQFYIEAPAVTPVGAVAAQAAGMHNLIRRIQRICAEGARFAEQVLQSSEPAPDDADSGDDSDDEDTKMTDGSPRSRQQAVTTEAVATPAQTTGAMRVNGNPATEATAGADASAASAAAEVTACGQPEAAKDPQHTVARSASPAASSNAAAPAAIAASHSACCAQTPANMEPPATDSSGPTSLRAAPVAADAGVPSAADGAEAAAAPPVLSEADEQFEALCRALLAASQLIATERAAQRQLLTVEELQGAVRGIAAAAGDACLGLAPGGNSLNRVLAEETAAEEAIHRDICPETAVLWVASRKLDNAKMLAAEVGRNDKTRVTVAVQHAKEPAPPRSMEPPPEEYDQMLAFYYKWQQKDRWLEADMDLGYYNSQWADPRSLKQALSGVGSVTMPKHGPKGFN